MSTTKKTKTPKTISVRADTVRAIVSYLQRFVPTGHHDADRLYEIINELKSAQEVSGAIVDTTPRNA